MKCPYCGNEIANDSVFCEFCGKKVVGTKKLKPLWITLAMLLVLCIVGGVSYYLGSAPAPADTPLVTASDTTHEDSSLQDEAAKQEIEQLKLEKEAAEQARKDAEAPRQEAARKAEEERRAKFKAQGLVDLGLPSGTLWKDKNESGFYTYDDAVSSFGSKLPNKEQFEELINSCQWIWHGKGYKVVGPSGNSIFLPAEGLLRCNGIVKWVGSLGYYWSSTSDDSGRARGLLYFNSGEVFMYKGNRCSGLSVRLVQ